MSSKFHYTYDDVVQALARVGVRRGDVVFTHSSVAMLGIPDCELCHSAIAELFLAAFRHVLGPDGTWILPSYSYSYTKNEEFNREATPPTADMGTIPCELWTHPDAVRSLDPMFSVIAFGGRTREVVGGIPSSCFGSDSVYARILELDGAICNIGIGSHSALLHHVEQKLGVQYRYLEYFDGRTVFGGQKRSTTISYNVRKLDSPRDIAYFLRLDSDARKQGELATASVGRSEVNLIRARRMEKLARDGLARDPEYLVLGDLSSNG